MVVHGMPYGGEFMSTWPGYTPLLYSFDYNAGPRLPDWNYMDDHMAYAARNQLVLQTGMTKRDVAFYHYDEPRSVTEGYNFSDLRAAGGYPYSKDPFDSFSATVLTIRRLFIRVSRVGKPRLW